jgi:hypothetical protein
MPQGSVGWGIVVGARESRAHQDEDGWRRPLAGEKRETKGTQCTRKLYTGGLLWNWRKGNRRFMVRPWRMITGAEPDAIKVASPVLNGEDEETGRKVLRLVLTQLPRFRFRQQVSTSVRHPK